MANYATLKAAIAAAIRENGNNEITGNLLQQQLLAMVNSLGVGYQYAGIATPTTNPGTPDQNVFYLASTAGTYTNFDALVLADGEIAILKYNGAWSKDSTGAASLEKVNQLGQQVIYDVTKSNPTAGPNNDGKFESLSALLSDANLSTLIPIAVRCGGMSIRFVQTSDNKYIQARCMAQNFTTDVTQWQGVDDEPTAGSDNLVKSRGVANVMAEKSTEQRNFLFQRICKDDLRYGALESTQANRLTTIAFIPVSKGDYLIENLGKSVNVHLFNSNYEYISSSEYFSNDIYIISDSLVSFIKLTFIRNSEEEISSYDGSVTIHRINDNIPLYKDSIDSFVTHRLLYGCGYESGDAENLDLTKENLYRCSVTNTGIVDNNSRRLSLLMKPLPAFSELTIIPTAGYNFLLGLYKMNPETGNITFESYTPYTESMSMVNSSELKFFVLTFYKSGTITKEEVLSNYVVRYSQNVILNKGYVGLQKPGIQPLYINNYSSWKQGIISNADNKKCDHNKPLSIEAGHLYLIKSSFYDEDILLGITFFNDNESSWAGWKSIQNDIVIQAPYGYDKLRITAQNSDGITPAQASSLNISIIDITAKSITDGAYKVAELTYNENRYAQGMAISNGYLFQAFSNGDFEIFKMSSFERVNTISGTEFLNGYHCNAIAFGEKYDDNDEFGVLYVSSNNIGGNMLAIRISRNGNDFSFEKLYDIASPSLDTTKYQSVTQWFDFDNKLLLQGYYDIAPFGNVGSYASLGDYHISVYSYNQLNGNTDFTLVSTTDFNQRFRPVQDGKVYNGILFFLFGGAGGRLCIVSYNIVNREIEYIHDIRKYSSINFSEEIQGVDRFLGELFISTTLGIYKIII